MSQKHSIVLVPYPFTENPQVKKVRPAVMLTRPAGKHKHAILAFISSRGITTKHQHELIIHKKDPGFAQTGLKVSSKIVFHKLTSIPINYIHRKLGATTPEQSSQIKDKLAQIFELTD